jgi:HSP90 family molecular chaperone
MFLGRCISDNCDMHVRRYIWESGADGAFAISEDTEGAPLGRGTQINIYLKVLNKMFCYRPLVDCQLCRL